jgi:hypothetical protein
LPRFRRLDSVDFFFVIFGGSNVYVAAIWSFVPPLLLLLDRRLFSGFWGASLVPVGEIFKEVEIRCCLRVETACIGDNASIQGDCAAQTSKAMMASLL